MVLSVQFATSFSSYNQIAGMEVIAICVVPSNRPQPLYLQIRAYSVTRLENPADVNSFVSMMHSWRGKDNLREWFVLFECHVNCEEGAPQPPGEGRITLQQTQIFDRHCLLYPS